MNLLVRLLRQLRALGLDLLQGRLQVGLELLRRVAQLANRHAHDAHALAVVGGPGRVADRLGHVADDRLHARRRHQALGTKYAAQTRLLERLFAALVAQEAVKGDVVVADRLKQGLLTDGDGTRSGCRRGDVAAFLADDGNLPVGADGVR